MEEGIETEQERPRSFDAAEQVCLSYYSLWTSSIASEALWSLLLPDMKCTTG